MRRFFNGLVVGIIFGAVGYWFVQTKMHQHPGLEQRVKTVTSTDQSAGNLSDTFKAKMEALDLRTDQIKDELSRTGKIVRRKAHDIGQEVSDAASDARIVAAIKASYAIDPNLSVWQISVSCTDGHVTLSGMVFLPEDIGRAVTLALNVDGVRDVISTIQVKTYG